MHLTRGAGAWPVPAIMPASGPPILVVLGGLPGTGKTTIARQLAAQLRATYLRVDMIEQALRSSLGLGGDVGAAGYEVAYATAEANLTPGRSVVADCVNPIPVTREAWRRVAERSNAVLAEIELVCSDDTEHRRRIETRSSDIPGFTQPSWADVVDRDYEPWPQAMLQIDTAKTSEREAIGLIVDVLRRIGAFLD